MRTITGRVGHAIAILSCGAFTALLSPGCSSGPDQPADGQTRFEPNWESIRTHQAPEWFHDAKLGIMIVWGLYSVPAWAPPTGELHQVDWNVWFENNPYAEWYQNSLRIDGTPTQKHHFATYGREFDYLDFIPQFNEAASKWDADAMAGVIADAGARYVVLVTKFHDGFVLWPTDVHNPNRAPDQQRSDRDIVGELAQAVRARQVRMGVYYSGGLDWSFTTEPIRTVADVSGTIIHTEEYARYADAHLRELIDRYQPDILWNDIGYPQPGDLEHILADYYNRFPDGVINNRWETRLPAALDGGDAPASPDTSRHHDFVTPEYAKMDDITDFKWETTRGLGFSFGYNQLEGPEETLKDDELIRLLVDVVSKNGNLLLGIGPRADGTIPEIQAARLRALGQWLQINGEAIFGSRPWSRASGKASGGLDVRFTRRGDTVYAVVLGKPPSDELIIDSFAIAEGSTVTLLGSDGPLEHHVVDGNLVVELPGSLPEAHAYTLRIAGGGQ